MLNQKFIATIGISALIASLLVLPAPVKTTYAQETGDQQGAGNQIVKNCKALTPLWNATAEMTDPGVKVPGPTEEDDTTDEIFTLFDNANVAYHSYIACIFDELVEAVLGAPVDDDSIFEDEVSETEGFVSANMPSLPEWLRPETACIAPDALQTLLLKTSPIAVLPTTLGAYTEYKTYLEGLASHFKGKIKIQTGLDITTETSLVADRLDSEMQDAIVALDSAFIVLKEMRQALVLHVGFQCLLGNLEKYRDILAEIRSRAEMLPDLVVDASTICPNQ